MTRAKAVTPRKKKEKSEEEILLETFSLKGRIKAFFSAATLRKIWASVLFVVISPYRLFKFLCFSIGFVVLMAAFGVSLYLYSVFDSVPQLEGKEFSYLKKKAQAVVRKKLESKNKLGRWVPLKKVSRELLYSLVMSEDSTFFQHEGVNYMAVLDAVAVNVKRGRYAFGASTISQQVVKNLFLTNEKTITRKIKEVVITKDLEKHFSKNEILEIYLNIAEFGPDIFGVGRASYEIFGINPSKMNAAEGAFLALLLPSPRKNYYILFQNENLTSAKKRKIRRILRDMYVGELISAKQYNQYLRYKYFGP